MGRMRCTWHELQATPLDKLAVFKAFIRGEEAARDSTSSPPGTPM